MAARLQYFESFMGAAGVVHTKLLCLRQQPKTGDLFQRPVQLCAFMKPLHHTFEVQYMPGALAAKLIEIFCVCHPRHV